MTTLETKVEQSASHVDEAVFVARDGRRARRLRNAAIVAGVLAILWVVGLGVGMLGFGSLPGVALVKGARADSRTPAATPSLTARAATARTLAAEAKAVRRISARIASVHGAGTAATARRSTPVSKASHPPVVTLPAAATQTSVNPALRTRGWARKGYQAPRGQLRKAAPPPPPATSRGRQVGRTKLQPAPTPAVPPGQAKKAVEPPPPPPPPKKV